MGARPEALEDLLGPGGPHGEGEHRGAGDGARQPDERPPEEARPAEGHPALDVESTSGSRSHTRAKASA